MPKQYIFLKDREINSQFSRWLYHNIITNYGSIDYFSCKSGICKANIYSWINGDCKPSRKNLRLISKAFYVLVDDLLTIMED